MKPWRVEEFQPGDGQWRMLKWPRFKRRRRGIRKYRNVKEAMRDAFECHQAFPTRIFRARNIETEDVLMASVL